MSTQKEDFEKKKQESLKKHKEQTKITKYNADKVAIMHARFFSENNSADDKFITDKIAAQDNKIAAQDNKIAAQDNKIAEHQLNITEHGNKIAEHQFNITEHDNKLTEHDNKIAAHQFNITEHGNKIAAHQFNITEHGNKIAEHQFNITEHGNKLTEHDEVIDIVTNEVADQHGRITVSEDQINEHTYFMNDYMNSNGNSNNTSTTTSEGTERNQGTPTTGALVTNSDNSIKIDEDALNSIVIDDLFRKYIRLALKEKEFKGGQTHIPEENQKTLKDGLIDHYLQSKTTLSKDQASEVKTTLQERLGKYNLECFNDGYSYVVFADHECVCGSFEDGEVNIDKTVKINNIGTILKSYENNPHYMMWLSGSQDVSSTCDTI